MSDDKELDRWNFIIDQIRGTCDSIEQVLYTHDAEDLQDHLPFFQELDQQIFRCECCGWWCEISEMSDSGNWACEGCEPEEDE